MSFFRLSAIRLSTISITSKASTQPFRKAKFFSQTTLDMANTPTSNIISERSYPELYLCSDAERGWKDQELRARRTGSWQQDAERA
jgi:hypothetical protein